MPPETYAERQIRLADDTAPAKQMYVFEVQDLTMEQAMQILRDFHAKGLQAESVPVHRDRRRF